MRERHASQRAAETPKWLALAAVCLLSVVSGQSASAANPKVISDLHKEWDDAEGLRFQPLGAWRLMRGSNTAEPGDFVEMDRYEKGVSQNPDVSIWSYGESIFNQPSFIRDKSRADGLITIHTDKDLEGNEEKGAAIIEWTSPVAKRVTLSLTLQNLGTDVKDGDGVTVHVLKQDGTSGSSFSEIETIVVPSANARAEAQTTDIAIDVEDGQRILLKIDPNGDGWGDNLGIAAKVSIPR